MQAPATSPPAAVCEPHFLGFLKNWQEWPFGRTRTIMHSDSVLTSSINISSKISYHFLSSANRQAADATPNNTTYLISRQVRTSSPSTAYIPAVTRLSIAYHCPVQRNPKHAQSPQITAYRESSPPKQMRNPRIEQLTCPAIPCRRDQPTV